jgi:hypothetical protein
MSFSIECFFERADAQVDISARRFVLVRLPLMQGEAEAIQLRLKARQPLLQPRIVLMHRKRE